MEDVRSVATLETLVLVLKNENKALKETVSKLLEELNSTRNINHSGLVTHLSPEEEICNFQIQQLQAVSRERKLSLEEVKTLDLLIKNKRLLSQKSTSNQEFTLPAKITAEELELIAGNVEDDTGKSSERSSSQEDPLA
jgi:hypothetical protein